MVLKGNPYLRKTDLDAHDSTNSREHGNIFIYGFWLSGSTILIHSGRGIRESPRRGNLGSRRDRGRVFGSGEGAPSGCFICADQEHWSRDFSHYQTCQHAAGSIQQRRPWWSAERGTHLAHLRLTALRWHRPITHTHLFLLAPTCLRNLMGDLMIKYVMCGPGGRTVTLTNGQVITASVDPDPRPMSICMMTPEEQYGTADIY